MSLALEAGVTELLGDSVLKYFRGCLFAVHPSSSLVAAATETHLLLGDVSSGSQVVLELNPSFGRATSLKWIDCGSSVAPDFAPFQADVLVCVGFESGDFGVFDINGELVSEHKLHTSALQSFQLSGQSADGGAALWILHEGGIVAMVDLTSRIYLRACVGCSYATT
jgi:hypothetical protein